MIAYSSVTNPRYVSQDNSIIACDVVFDGVGEDAVPFAASASDCTEHGREIYTRAVAGEFGAVAPYAPSLASIKADAIAAIDAEAEAQRLVYITPGAGQAMTYDAKQVEAREILFDAGTIAAADAMDGATLKATYPMVWASIPTSGATASQAATAIQAQALAWAAKGAEIEKARMDAKAAVVNAVTTEQVAAARVVSWP